MILRSPTENEMAAYRRIVVETPFPLMGKAGKGVLGNRTEHHPYLYPSPSRGRIRTLSPDFVLFVVSS